jgi:T5orf172 domain
MILSVENEARFGWPSRQSTLRQRVSGYTRDGRAKRFKVGITNNPPKRAGEHNAKKHPYRRMVILYGTRSQKNVQGLETWLIEIYRNRGDNVRSGGAGRYGKGWKYVYVLLG